MTTATRGRPRSFDLDAALDKAILLFWRQGYEATSVRALSDELGIGTPSLYSAFGDKKQLFLQAVQAYDAKYGGFINRALLQEPTAKTVAARILREAPERYTRRGLPAGCLIVSGDAGTSDVQVVTELTRLRDSKTLAIAARIRADIATGVLPTHVDPLALARYTIVVLNGIAHAANDGVKRAELQRVSALALNVWP